MDRLTILTRDLTPFEHLVAGLVCDGLSNAAIARETAHSEKVVENTISRMAKALGVKSGPDINIRVDRKSTRLNSSHVSESRMPSSA